MTGSRASVAYYTDDEGALYGVPVEIPPDGPPRVAGPPAAVSGPPTGSGLDSFTFDRRGMLWRQRFRVHEGRPFLVGLPEPTRATPGLGDRVAAVTKALGVRECGGCRERRERMNGGGRQPSSRSR